LQKQKRTKTFVKTVGLELRNLSGPITNQISKCVSTCTYGRRNLNNDHNAPQPRTNKNVFSNRFKCSKPMPRPPLG